MTVVQSPLDTGFGPYTTAAEVAQGVDLSGQTAIVTGGASNIGRETVRVLAAAGADVIVPARDTNAARLFSPSGLHPRPSCAPSYPRRG